MASSVKLSKGNGLLQTLIHVLTLIFFHGATQQLQTKQNQRKLMTTIARYNHPQLLLVSQAISKSTCGCHQSTLSLMSLLIRADKSKVLQPSINVVVVVCKCLMQSVFSIMCFPFYQQPKAYIEYMFSLVARFQLLLWNTLSHNLFASLRRCEWALCVATMVDLHCRCTQAHLTITISIHDNYHYGPVATKTTKWSMYLGTRLPGNMVSIMALFHALQACQHVTTRQLLILVSHKDLNWVGPLNGGNRLLVIDEVVEFEQ